MPLPIPLGGHRSPFVFSKNQTLRIPMPIQHAAPMYACLGYELGCARLPPGGVCMFGEMHVELPGVTESVCPHVSMQLRAMKPCANRRSALRFPLMGQGIA